MTQIANFVYLKHQFQEQILALLIVWKLLSQMELLMLLGTRTLGKTWLTQWIAAKILKIRSQI
jgi:predicted AAA+ superfamily ATPase